MLTILEDIKGHSQPHPALGVLSKKGGEGSRVGYLSSDIPLSQASSCLHRNCPLQAGSRQNRIHVRPRQTAVLPRVAARDSRLPPIAFDR